MKHVKKNTTLAAFAAVLFLGSAAHAALYSAVSFDPYSGSLGKAWNYGSFNGAKLAAYRACGRATCRTTVSTGCVALAVVESGPWTTKLGFAGHYHEWSQAQAERNALDSCDEISGGAPCYVRASFCSDRF